MKRRLAGLLLAGLAVSACAPASASAERVIDIEMNHSAFDVTSLDARVGETVTFRLHNADPIDHEFILGDQAVQDRHEEGTEAHHEPKPGEVSIPAGASAETTYTFTKPGVLEFACHLPGHYAYGMNGQVIVE